MEMDVKTPFEDEDDDNDNRMDSEDDCPSWTCGGGISTKPKL